MLIIESSPAHRVSMAGQSIGIAGGAAPVMLSAYYDASFRATGTFAVAAVAFGKSNAKMAQREWRRAFGSRTFHMADLHARRREFKDCSSDEADRLCRAAVRIVNRYATYQVAISCSQHDSHLLPRWDDPETAMVAAGFKEAFPACFNLSMVALSSLVPAQKQRKHIDYFLEHGDLHSNYAHKFVAGMPESIREMYFYNSHAFVSKGEPHRLLEAADLLAWEWAKHIDRISEGKPARPSLRALANFDIGMRPDVQLERFIGKHMDTSTLASWSQKVLDSQAAARADWKAQHQQ